MVQVVAAIIERQGRLLTPEQALARELEEELGILGAAGQEIMRYQYSYPGRDPILLIFFRVLEFGGEPRNVVFHEMRWEPAAKLAEFDFLEGDIQFIRANRERVS
jgi:8-oxo-dGTP diphosphatase